MLDVGAGPITQLGYVSRKYDIHIIAIDALADQYGAMLAQAGIVPPVRTHKCRAEQLDNYLGEEPRFHVAYSRNALDHCIDPRTAVISMARRLLPEGLLYIAVAQNEGRWGNYEGLHNWNFDVESDNLILWREGERYNISEDLSPFGSGRATLDARWIVFFLHRSNAVGA